MDLWIALAVFAAYFVIDVIYVQFVRSVAQGSAWRASACSVGIYLFMAFGVVQYVENRWYLIPLALGAWLGTFMAVKLNLGETNGSKN